MKNKFLVANMKTAYVWAEMSHSKRNKVGAVLYKDRIITHGYNGTPAGTDNVCEDDNNVTKPTVRHAEINALNGLRLSNETAIGASLFVTLCPCHECAYDIIDSGIKDVYFHQYYRCLSGVKYLVERGIKVKRIQWNEESTEPDKEVEVFDIIIFGGLMYEVSYIGVHTLI